MPKNNQTNRTTFQWTVSRNGNPYTKTGDVIAVVTHNEDEDRFRLSFRVDAPFFDEEEAKQVAEEVLSVLERTGLVEHR